MFVIVFFAGCLYHSLLLKLSEASSSIEQAGVRSRKIERQLKNVQELPKPEVLTLLDEVAEIGEQEDISINDEEQSI